MSFLEVQAATAWGRTLESFAAWCRPPAGARTLDVGCGPGLLPTLFSSQGCAAAGVDLDFDSLVDGRAHFDLDLDLAQSQAEQLPFPGESFDLLTASNVLFLLPNPETALREMRRVVSLGGQVCVLNPSEQMSVAAARQIVEQRGLQGLERESLLNWAARAEAHRRWNEPELRALFEQAGLRLVESRLKVGPGLARLARGVRA